LRDDAAMNSGRTVFGQLLELLPRRAFDSAIERYDGAKKVRGFSCMDQLLCMVFAQLTGRASLRETVSCLRALGSRRYHCGIRVTPARSTLAEANERRDFRIFMDMALSMIASARMELPVDADLKRLKVQAFAIDSTTIDLCLKLFPWALFRRRKAGIKAHTMIDLRVGIPVFMRVSHAKVADVSVLDEICFQAGAFYVMDRGYVDFARFYRIHLAGAFFITRSKRRMDCRVRERLPVKPDGAVKRDQRIRLRGPKSRRLYPDTLRRVRFIDPETGKRLTFLTNHLTLDALSIALLYRKRWKIELLFKWIEAAPAYQGVLRHDAQRGQDATVDRGNGLCADSSVEAPPRANSNTQRNRPNPQCDGFRENPDKSSVFRHPAENRRERKPQPVDTIRLLTGHY
jgi:Domain of unknown function (DUF4372)/Transposase DDE domain